MALIGSLNFRDPRFQRALAMEAASRPYAALPVTGAATGAFAGQDLSQRLAFGQLGLQKQMFDANMRYQQGLLGLDKKRLQMRSDELGAQQRQLPWQIGIGGLTSFMSLLEGRRQAAEVRETNRLAAARQERQIAAAEDANRIRRGER